MESPKTPKTLYALVCEDGTLYADGSGLRVFSNIFHAQEEQEELGHIGWVCRCRDHHIVVYEPKPEPPREKA